MHMLAVNPFKRVDSCEGGGEPPLSTSLLTTHHPRTFGQRLSAQRRIAYTGKQGTKVPALGSIHSMLRDPSHGTPRTGPCYVDTRAHHQGTPPGMRHENDPSDTCEHDQRTWNATQERTAQYRPNGKDELCREPSQLALASGMLMEQAMPLRLHVCAFADCC